MAKSKGSKVYAVARGRVPGIYSTWSECQAQTSGFRGAVFKSFKTHGEAQAFVRANSLSGSSSGSPALAAPAASMTPRPAQCRKRTVEGGPASSRRNKIANRQMKPPPGPSSPLQITIHFDGGSRGNPGVAGAGAEVVIANNSTSPSSTRTYLIREYCGERATNNYAEYKGLLAGLEQAKRCIEQYTKKHSSQSSKTPLPLTAPSFQVRIFGDSDLIIKQLKGAYQCRNPNIRPLFDQSQRLISELRNMGRLISEKSKMGSEGEISFEHVYREHNKTADALANEAMDRRESWTTTAADNPTDHGSSENVQNNDKNSVAVPLPLLERNKGKAATSSSQREVIDTDDDDNDSHYSV